MDPRVDDAAVERDLGDARAGGVLRDVDAEEHPVGALQGLALGQDDVDLLVAVEVGDGDPEVPCELAGMKASLTVRWPSPLLIISRSSLPNRPAITKSASPSDSTSR